jgi:ribonuclease D
MTRFDTSGVATLQLSTDDMSIIFDCVALENSDAYKQFLLKFFADEKIEKIGHSFSSDIHALNATFNIELVRI